MALIISGAIYMPGERELSVKWAVYVNVKSHLHPGSNTKCVLSVTTTCTVYPKKYAHGFVVLCFVVVMQSFIMNSHEAFIHIHQGCFAGTGAIVRLPQCQWSKPDRYGKISQCITTTKHSKAKTVCIFLGIYCMTPLISTCFIVSSVSYTPSTFKHLFLVNVISFEPASVQRLRFVRLGPGLYS